MNKVLIIEDEVTTAAQVHEALAINSVEADIAKDGAEGIKMFNEREYDLVLLDLKMPGMDGEQVLTEIRKVDPFVDVIVYTNYSEFADIKKLTNIGIQGYINKGPKADLSELLETILEKLAPLTEEGVNKLIKHTPEELFDE